MNHRSIIELLKAEVVPTSGCTEPGAVALATAHASGYLSDPINQIIVHVNPNIFKNGVAVGIPGTDQTGLHIAAALGAIKRHPEKQLMVLENVTDEDLQAAKNLVKQNIVQIEVDSTISTLWIKAQVKAGDNLCEAIIRDRHTNVVNITLNGKNVFSKESLSESTTNFRAVLSAENTKIDDIIKVVEEIPYTDMSFLLDGVEMNLHAANTGLDKKSGLGIGAMFSEMVKNGVLSNDIVSNARILTAAATDARMAGENIQVMSSAGSGNHGITVTLPVYAAAKNLGSSEEQLIRAIALSHLITIYVKIHTGSLSALCGCAVAAATGAASAITWLMGGKEPNVAAAIKLVIANLTGMICDGGKVGCALKLATAASCAVESALLAQGNVVVPATNGILAETPEDTIANLGMVSNPGMLTTDKIILDLMLNKN